LGRFFGVQGVAVRPSVSPAGDGFPGDVLRGKAGLATTEARKVVATSRPRFGTDENRRSAALFPISGRIRPGDRLPGERDMALTLQVGRSTIREASRALEALDLIRVRPGTGTYVVEPSATASPDPIESASNMRPPPSRFPASQTRAHRISRITPGPAIRLCRPRARSGRARRAIFRSILRLLHLENCDRLTRCPSEITRSGGTGRTSARPP
jgi:hypothetical protein